MDEKNMDQGAAQTADQGAGGEKSFTQDDVNRIVSERLARDRAKSLEEVSKKEKELMQREFRLNSRQKLIDRGYPESLFDALNSSSEEAFGKAIDIIDNLIRERTASNNGQTGLSGFRAVGAPGNNRFDSGEDPIRKAMGLLRKEH